MRRDGLSEDLPANRGIVLIHGAMHGGWCWDRLRPHLQDQSLAIDLPGRGPTAATSDLSVRDYIAHAERAVVERGWQEVVVIAHSFGGVTACGLADAIRAKVRHVVFIASVIPLPGARAIDIAPKALRRPLERGFGHAVARGGSYKLPDRVARYLFCNDFNPAEIRDLQQRLCAEPANMVFERMEFGAPEGISMSWIRPRHDRALSRRVQDQMIRRLGNATVWEMDGGHDIMISRPLELADILNGITERAFLSRRG
jgi:pimeloyl-ACP methyl ester carboxylesterase